MTKIQPKEKFIIIHPKEDDGSEVKFSLILVLSRKLSDKIGPEENIEIRLMRALSTTDGVDSVNPQMGRYTVGVTIARTFDPDQVIAEIKRKVEEDVLSEIVRPKLVTPE